MSSSYPPDTTSSSIFPTMTTEVSTTTAATSTTVSSSTTESVTSASTSFDVIVGSAVAAGVVFVVILATVIILCIVITRKRTNKMEFSSSDKHKSDSEKGKSKDGGYINALYDVDAVTGDLCREEAEKAKEQQVDGATDQDRKQRDRRVSQNSKSSKGSANSKTSKTSQSSKASKTSNKSKSTRNSKVSSTISTGNYDYASDGNVSPGSRSPCSLPIGINNNTDKERSSREGSYEYAYATTSMDRISSSTSTSSTRSPKKRAFTGSSRMHSLRRENEMLIYVAPAMDENSLYAQFAEIRVKCLSREKIKITDMIGSGQFGKVHQGEWASSGDQGKLDVALKTLKEGAGEQDKVKFLQEAAIMGQFSHPNVVKLHGVVTEGEPMMIVLELLPKGDLRNYLFSLRNNYGSEEGDEHTLLSFCRQIAAGMCYLASKAFIHRDLAARNILVSEDGICKIADFGMSRDLMDENYYISHGGKIPVKWTAPEALHFKKFSTASDVWSFGCVMYEIWSLGHKPFESWSNNQAIIEVDEGIRLAPPPGCPRAVYEIAIQCWHPETSQRPSFTDIMQRFSLPDTKLLKWSEEDKVSDPEAAILGADLDAGFSLYKDLQERYLLKEAETAISKNNNVGVAEQSYDDPVSVSFAENKTNSPARSNLEVKDGLDSCKGKEFPFLPPLQENRLNEVQEMDKVGAHSYEDPVLLTLLKEKNDTVFDL